MTLRRLCVVVIGLVIGGCCLKGGARKEPPYPGVKLGWDERDIRGIHLLGSFVLKTGETLENGNVQIKVIEMAPSDPCAGQYSLTGSDRVSLRFTRKTDQKVLCESIFNGQGLGTLSSAPCGDVTKESDIGSLYIKAINITDGWVYFELTK